MLRDVRLPVATTIALAVLGTSASAEAQSASEAPCVQCLRVRVGPPVVVRGPFPDELDAPFTALKLADGTMRGFSANGTTFAIDGPTLAELGGERQPVLEAGSLGSLSECGRWLTSVARSGEMLVGFVHQERVCDYDQGRTDKSMAIATSTDDGLTWTDLGTVITGRDAPSPEGITGEGDCTMVDGHDGYFYAYCLRNSDWQTIAARAPIDQPTDWRKYYEGDWSEPGLGGRATAIGFLGPGAGYWQGPGWVATVATDPWFGGVRLSLSADKVTFVDFDEPLLPIDGSEWERPADTGLIAYGTMLDPETGSNTINGRFLLAYIYVPPNQGFESRYLVLHEVAISLDNAPSAAQAGMALTRWSDPAGKAYVTSTGPLTGDRVDYRRDTIVAYLLTRAPDGGASVKLAECSSDRTGRLDYLLAEDGDCHAAAYKRERTAGWLYADAQPGTLPVYRCIAARTETHFASSAPDCEGLGSPDRLLGYGLAP